MNAYRSLLHNRPQFRLLWIAQVISLTGDWFNTIAVLSLVTRYTDSSTAVGALFLARALPAFFWGPIAGVVADRFNRQWILVLSNLLRIFVVLGFLLVRDESSVWLVYFLSVAQFSISAFFEPAYNALLPALVSREELISANTLGSITWSVMLTLGAVIGGVTTAIAGVQASLLIDALTFAAAAYLLYRIALPPAPAQPAQAGPRPSGRVDFIDGLRHILRHPAVALIVVVKAISHIGSVDIMIASYSEKVFPIGAEGAVTAGLLFAAFGLGSVLGPLGVNWWSNGSEGSMLVAIAVGFVMIPLGWALYAVAPTLEVLLLAAIVRGAGGSINWTFSSVLLQQRVPDQMLGRIFGLDFTLFTLVMSLSVWLPSVAFDAFGISPREMAFYLALLSLLPLLIWTWLAFLPPRKRLAAEEAPS